MQIKKEIDIELTEEDIRELIKMGKITNEEYVIVFRDAWAKEYKLTKGKNKIY